MSSRSIITITVMLGMIMAIIDTTIVNVAINTIGGNLGASVDEVSWVATGYILSNVCVMPLNGWLTAYLGRKRFYAASVALFTIASFLCGTATSITQLIIWRVLQGIGGGALQPTAQAILFEAYPKEERGAAMAIFGMGAMVGPAIGPTLGGYIIDNASWPLIFYINIPIGIVAFLMAMAFIPDEGIHDKPKGGIDWLGLSLLTMGLASLQYVLERGEHDEWFSSPTIWILTIVAISSLAIFIYSMLRSKHPLVDLHVFRISSFTIGQVIGVVTGFGLFGTALILPLFVQTSLNLTAFDTGMVLLPGALSTAVSMLIIGRIANKVDPRASIAFGMLIFAWSCWWLGSLSSQAGYWDVTWPRIIQGFGLGFLFVPLSTVTLNDVPIKEMAGATGVNTLVRQLGGSLGIAILTTLLVHQTGVIWNILASGITQTHGYSIPLLTGLVAQQSAIIAYDYLFRLTAIVFIICVPLVFLIHVDKKKATVVHAAAID